MIKAIFYFSEDIQEKVILFKIQDAWKNHPLRDRIENYVAREIFIKVEIDEEFNIDSSQFPNITLKIKRNNCFSEIIFSNIIIHEYTHLIDNLDMDFMGDANSGEIAHPIRSYPHSKKRTNTG